MELLDFFYAEIFEKDVGRENTYENAIFYGNVAGLVPESACEGEKDPKEAAKGEQQEQYVQGYRVP
jgi:hypothetical protein